MGWPSTSAATLKGPPGRRVHSEPHTASRNGVLKRPALVPTYATCLAFFGRTRMLIPNLGARGPTASGVALDPLLAERRSHRARFRTCGLRDVEPEPGCAVESTSSADQHWGAVLHVLSPDRFGSPARRHAQTAFWELRVNPSQHECATSKLVLRGSPFGSWVMREQSFMSFLTRRVARRLGPIGVALTVYDIWNRLPEREQQRLIALARAHGSGSFKLLKRQSAKIQRQLA